MIYVAYVNYANRFVVLYIVYGVNTAVCKINITLLYLFYLILMFYFLLYTDDNSLSIYIPIFLGSLH